jgi:hypothetical protein
MSTEAFAYPTLCKERKGWGTRRLVARRTVVKEDGETAIDTLRRYGFSPGNDPQPAAPHADCQDSESLLPPRRHRLRFVNQPLKPAMWQTK